MVTEELENIWEDDVPALATAADTTEILVRDPAASAGNRIKDMTVTVLYNRLKTLLDTAYGAFVTRWPTYAEVTGKPEFFVMEYKPKRPQMVRLDYTVIKVVFLN
jgi:hypothetical protein